MLRKLPILAVLLLPALAPAQTFAKAKARYDQCMGRPPMVMKYRGRLDLAKSRDPRALEILANSYAGIEAPRDRNQGIIVSLLSQYYGFEENLETFKRLRDDNEKTEDAWLWFKALSLQARYEGTADLLKLLEKERDPFLRAAVLEALLVAGKKSDGLANARQAIATLPSHRKKLEYTLTIGAVMEGFLAMSRHLKTPEYQESLEMVVALLDGKRTPRHAKLLIARYLGEIFNSDSRSINAAPWRLQMKAGRNEDVAREGYATTFFDIPSSGDRIAYVVDMSDSMLTPIPEKYRKRGRTTGPSKKPQRRRKYDPFVDSYEIPWHKVQNRFDLARENLKLSLYRLPKTKSFAVIGFGDEAGLLRGCIGMMPATKKNIRRVIKQLDAIRPGPKIADRPHGTLRGKTNIHGGIQRAFGVRAKGFVKEWEYVDKRTHLEGADTIYVLSDGDPTWDDFNLVAPNYNEDRIGDPETRTPHEPMENLHYSGPFWRWPPIIDDVERMNLFRKAEIHCIGIGEVQVSQLERLAKIGKGETKKLGE